MKRSVWLATALALLVATGAAQAHTRLMKAAPADGSVIDALPEAIELHFSEATRITTLTLQRVGEKGRSLGPLPQQPVEKISVPTPELGPGRYVLSWRAVSRDNHIASGQVRFTVSQAASEGKSTTTAHVRH